MLVGSISQVSLPIAANNFLTALNVVSVMIHLTGQNLSM